MKDVREEVCEKASDYVLALDNAEFANAFGGVAALLADLRKAVRAWEANCDESSSRGGE